MRSQNIRFVLVLATLSLAGICAAQIYWVRAAFNQEQDHFHREVNAALNQVANEFYAYNKVIHPETNPIRQLAGNYYVVMVNSPIDANLLDNLLKKTFAKRDLNTDFEYGIYDCDTKCMVFDEYVKSGTVPMLERMNRLPVWDKSNYYFGVYFPNKELYLLNRMEIWIFTTLVMLVVILFFGYTLFVILKQKRLSEIQKDFISNMTHEFKTPISTIEVASKVLQQPEILREPERLLNYATIINKENKRLQVHVERVLQLASLENDTLQLEKSIVNVHKLIKESVGQFNTTLNTSNLTLDLLASNDSVNADKLHLTNVIYNLLDNAIKYSPDGPEIMIHSKNEKNHIVVSIIDKGIGMTLEEVKHVFDKFYRVTTGIRHDVKGFGIGLSYVKLIIREMGGSINVESTSGNGSAFIFKLKNGE